MLTVQNIGKPGSAWFANRHYYSVIIDADFRMSFPLLLAVCFGPLVEAAAHPVWLLSRPCMRPLAVESIGPHLPVPEV
jgi:hypothetical protein